MISAEDRERLARGKFLDWLFEGLDDEKVNKKLDERIDGRIAALTGRSTQSQQQGSQQQQQGSLQQEQHQPQRKRSLFDMAISDTFNW
jgi:hypothetical protein